MVRCLKEEADELLGKEKVKGKRSDGKFCSIMLNGILVHLGNETLPAECSGVTAASSRTQEVSQATQLRLY